MSFRLGLGPLIGSNREKGQARRGEPRQAGRHEALMPRHVNKSPARIAPVPVSIAQLNGEPPTLLLC